MAQQTIKKSIRANAPKEKVWEVLLEDKFARIWYAAFSEGAHAVTDWQTGSKVTFTDNSGDGLIGRVLVNKPHEMVSVEYTGVLAEGKEDYDSQEAIGVKGGRETYLLLEKDGITRLSIECDMAAEMFELMSRSWDKALEKVKDLSENY